MFKIDLRGIRISPSDVKNVHEKTMSQKRPKVLMLGWEFPPIINGGLGVACHDLSQAMTSMASITMVIPKTSTGFQMDNMQLIGLNMLDAASKKNAFTDKAATPGFERFTIDADLNPYSANISEEPFSMEKLRQRQKDIGADTRFDLDTLYGGDVISKVVQYAARVAELAKDMDFDIIHAHDWMTMLAGIFIKEASGKPLVIHIHSLEYDRSGIAAGWVYELEKHGMEMADLLMPVSHYTADVIARYYGISKKKMAVIHNGTSIVKPFKKSAPYAEKTVLFVGRLTRQKGPTHFLDIASAVLAQHKDVRFVMAGVGDYFSSIIEKSANDKLGNRFHMTGFLNTNRLRDLFAISDVYCMPSLSEPFGLSAVEAAQFSIPCVISKQSGVAEVLPGSLKFDFWDTRKAADYIINLLRDPVFAQKVSADAVLNLNQISWPIAASKIIDAYRDFSLLN